MDENAPPKPGRLAHFMYTPDDSSASSTSITPRVAAPPVKRKLEEDDDNESDNTRIKKPKRKQPTTTRTVVRSRSMTPSAYAPPTTYAHLPLLPDALAPNLLVLFVGLNPGVATARCGHAYAHPSNLFWRLMHSSGILPEKCTADEDYTLPARFRLGLTNIVARPTRSGAELRPAELDAGVAVLERKARRWRPEAVCMVGKGIWDAVVRVRARADARADARRPKPAFRYGWQSESENLGKEPVDQDDDGVEDGVKVNPDWRGARVFVASSTSGLAASLRPAEKEAIWRQLGEWVETRRAAAAAETETETR